MSEQILEATELTRAAVEALSARFDEPAWVRTARLGAFDRFEQSPWPSTQDERWRRTDLSGLAADRIRPFVEGASDPLPAAVRLAGDRLSPAAGLLVQRNATTVSAHLDADLAARGVVFTDLHAAVRDHPDLVEPHLMQLIRADEGKFQALHAAFWSGGTFVYVPAGVEVALPLLTLSWIDAPDAGLFPHILLIAEPGSRVTLINASGLDSGGRALVVPAAEIIIHDGAAVRHATVQNWGREVWEIGVLRAQIERDATLHNLLVALGGGVVKADVESILAGPGASSEMLGLVFGDGGQHYDIHTLQEHAAPHTLSDLLYKNAVKNHASSSFVGMIRVHPGAQKTNAFQSNRNLILSEGSRAISDPKLEILANDLRCTHGSATSRLNEEHLFYLMSRGLTREQAVRMVVEGFFAELLDRVPLAPLADSLRGEIAVRMTA
ncbi:MAG TPA: Fe-S cluster assembly protein SufD [bacterium]|jgi:Fe-S cluster assembly protein SufD